MKNKIAQVNNKVLYLLPFAVLSIFPFSFAEITTKWLLLFALILLYLIVRLIWPETFKPHYKGLTVVYGILIMVTFDFAEKVNFVEQFDVPLELSWTIPLSTLILSLATCFFLLKILFESKITFSIHAFIKYLIISCFFLGIVTIFFFPIIFNTYHIQLNPIIELFKKILKYLLLVILLHLSQGNGETKHLNVGFIGSISIVLTLSIIYKISGL